MPSSGESSKCRDCTLQSRSPTLQADSLPSEPPGKPNHQEAYGHVIGHTREQHEVWVTRFKVRGWGWGQALVLEAGR